MLENGMAGISDGSERAVANSRFTLLDTILSTPYRQRSRILDIYNSQTHEQQTQIVKMAGGGYREYTNPNEEPPPLKDNRMPSQL